MGAYHHGVFPGVRPVVVGALTAALCAGCADAPAADPCAAAYVRVVMTGVERSTDVQALDEGMRPGRMLTADGQSTDPVFSPDGRQLAFISGAGYDRSSEHGNDRQSLYVMDLGDSQVRRLSSDHRDARPAWSSDGSQIAIIRRPEGFDERQVVVVDVESGAERVLGAGTQWRQVAWGSGDELLVTAWREDGIAADLLSLSASDGAVEHVGVVPASFLVWNPDRTAAAFGRSQLEESDVAVLDIASGVVTPVPRSASAMAQPLLWTVDDVLLLTINNRGDTYGIAGSDGGTQPPQMLSARWPETLGTGPVAANPRCRAAG